jgi:UDP-N-acetylmuramoylalanine--D-glutamate ligase
MKDKNVLIIGLGVTGVSSLNYVLNNHGFVYVVEGKNRSDFDKEKIEDFEKRGVKIYFEKDDFDFEKQNIDLIITSPGVKYSHPVLIKALSLKIPIHNDITLFIEKFREIGPIIGVTGSNGKSTIVSMMSEALNYAGHKSILVGNIGKSPLDYLDQKLEKNTIAVIELSSYQLETFSKEHFVDIAIITNLSSNHLDRYKNKMSLYALAKLKIGSDKKTQMIIDVDDEGNQKYILPNASDFYKELFTVSLKTHFTEATCSGIYTNEKSDLVYFDGKNSHVLLDRFSERNLIGTHNLYNIATVMMTFNLLKVLDDKIIKFIREYKGLEHRIEKVAVINNVLFINDSKSTSPDATRVAIESLATNKNIILIAGGENKGMEFSLIIPHIQESVRAIFLLPGDAGELLEKQIREAQIEIPIEWVDNMSSAVSGAFKFANAEDIVLLSPSSSSLNIFKSFEDRGEHFKQAVLNLKYV